MSVAGSVIWFLGQVPLRGMSSLLSWVSGAQRPASPADSVCACASATSSGSPSAHSPWCTGRSLHTWKAAKQNKHLYFQPSAVVNNNITRGHPRTLCVPALSQPAVSLNHNYLWDVFSPQNLDWCLPNYYFSLIYS